MAQKKIPAKFKVLRGNPGKKKIAPEPEGVPVDGLECPSWMKGKARLHFQEMVRKLSAEKLLTEKDLDLVCLYAEAMSDYRQAVVNLRKEGAIVTSKRGGPRKNPWMLIKKESFDQIRRCLEQLGATPQARAKVAPVQEKKQSLKEMIEAQVT